MKKNTYLQQGFAILCVTIFLFSILAFNEIFHMSKNHCKEYVSQHIKEFVDDTTGHYYYRNVKYKGFYYTDVSIYKPVQNSNYYQIIFWGDRNSIYWYLKKDRRITIDLDYDRYKYNSIDSRDIAIVSILSNYYK